MNEEVRNIKFRNKAKIIETKTGKYVEKTKKKDLNELFNYLSIRNFNNYPKVLDETTNSIRYEYIENAYMPLDEKGRELVRVLSSLHYKTTYYKDVSRKKYKQIYDKIISNIDYLKGYYEEFIKKAENEEYMSPSNYLIARNFTIIRGALMFAETEVNKWYRLVKDKAQERVSVIHNNIRTDHFIRGDDGYLVSWDESIVDTPILDLYKFYKSEFNNYDFKILFNEYNSVVGLTEEEKKLLLTLLSIPSKIEYMDSELETVKHAKSILDYIYKTNYLVTSGVFNIEKNEATN